MNKVNKRIKLNVVLYKALIWEILFWKGNASVHELPVPFDGKSGFTSLLSLFLPASCFFLLKAPQPAVFIYLFIHASCLKVFIFWHL